LTTTSATIVVTSTHQTVTLSIGESAKFDVLDDGFYDLLVELVSISTNGNKAEIKITSIHEEVPVPVEEPEDAPIEPPVEDDEEVAPPPVAAAPGEEPSRVWVWVVVIIILVIIVIVVIMVMNKKGGESKIKNKGKGKSFY